MAKAARVPVSYSLDIMALQRINRNATADCRLSVSEREQLTQAMSTATELLAKAQARPHQSEAVQVKK